MKEKNIKIPLLAIIYIAIFVFALMNITGFLNSHILVHIKLGEWMIDNGEIIKKDIFSYGETIKNWTNYYWLTDIIYASLYRNYGMGAILVMHAAIIASSFSIVILFLYKKKIKGASMIIYFIIGLYASLPQWGAMPYSFNFLFLTAFIYMFDSYYEMGKKRHLIFIVILQIFWVNMNSEFFYPFIIILFYVISELISILKKDVNDKKGLKKIGIVFFILCPILFLNPYGIREVSNVLLGYVFMIKDRRNDWAAPDFHGFARYSNILLAFSLITVFLFKKKELIKERKYMLIYIFVVFSFLYAQRHIMIFALISIMFLPMFIEYDNSIKNNIIRKMHEKLNLISEKLYAINSGKIINIILILSVTIMFFFNIRQSEDNFKEIISKWGRSSGVKYLKENKIEGNGFHSDAQGDMIIWYNYPKMKVFVDSREGVYSGKYQNKYAKIMLLTNQWEKIVKESNINWIFLQKSQITNVIAMMNEKWVLVYESRYSVIFLKKEYYEKIKNRIKIVKE